MRIRNCITFQRQIGTLIIMFFFPLRLRVAVEVTKLLSLMRLFMGGTHMMDSCVYHTTEKKTDFHSDRYEPCWSRTVCDSQASRVSSLWIQPIISIPLLQSLELFLTLIFGLTSSDLLHHHKIAWQSGLLNKPGYHLWAGLSFLWLGSVGWALASKGPCPAGHGIFLSNTSLRESWCSPCPDT